MKSEIGAKRLHITEFLRRLFVVLLCLNIVLSAFSSMIIFTVQASDSDSVNQTETREEIKARLMQQIRNDGWDPYSEDMTVAEFYALMELFDEGKLPLKNNSNTSSPRLRAPGMDEPGIEEPSTTATENYIPRTKFLFAGLSKYERRDESDDDEPLPYDNNTDYEPAYPQNLDPYNLGYKRPPMSWAGIEVKDTRTNRVVLVSEGVNDKNMAVAGNVVQDLFAKYTGYYVKQVTVNGANINVLGMIEVDDRLVYYYLSAEDQNTQVSTTTLPDEAKFIIEYVPSEHEIDYKVKLNDEYVTDNVPDDVVIFGSNSPTKVSWADSIFGASRPNRTTDGAYSFDVLVPYGYELRILISIDMTVDIPYVSHQPTEASFFVEIDHTGKKDAVHDAWLSAYCTYLLDENLVSSETEFYNNISEKKDENGNITLTWNDTDDPNRLAHDSVLAKMAERINDFVEHNNGYPLGTYPDYSLKGEGGFKILPDATNGPTEHTMNDTFYNHLVKADRTVTAVLTKQAKPTFDVSRILQKSDGASGRGSSADEDFAFASLEHYDEDYDYHKNGGTLNGSDDPLSGHGSIYPNVKSGDGWKWTNDNNGFRSSAQKMKQDADGTYYYTWLFQTNSDEGGYYLDAFEVNGIPITIPFYPKYNWNDSYVFQGETEKADAKHPYYTETTLADGSILKLEFLLGWNSGPPQRHYRVTVTGARSNVVVTGLNLMTGTGAPEFVTYNLVGVYSDKGGYSQTASAIEYYDRKAGWTRKAQANVIVQDDKNNVYTGIDYNNGDADNHGANIRFKITEGYGSPYYIWTNRHGDVINGQASVQLDAEWNIISTNDIKPLEDVENETMLDSQYIYYDGGDGYYYIRVTNQNNNTPGKDAYRFALLTVVARTIKYTVRYTPENDDGGGTWNGFVMNPDTGELEQLTQEWADENKAQALDLDPDSMPTFEHNSEICDLWDMAKDPTTGEVPDEYQAVLHQYDDNKGPFYDLVYNTMASIASDSYGTIRPKDKNNRYTFQNWILVDENFMPVKNAEGKYIQFLGGAIDVVKYANYAVKHVAFGNADTDIHVFRLMPVWSYIEDPLVYHVVLNWVDNLGNVHAENFQANWDDVVTEMTVDEKVYVYINKDAKPFLDWISNHPTYTFWDAVNNATDVKQIETALAAYLAIGGGHEDKYENILAALTQDDFYDINGNLNTGNKSFERVGKDIFTVNNDGTISIWMYENKGGLVFHKDVQEEPFTPDDEFYFTITDAKVGNGYTTPLSGEYKAYPQFVYDANGEPRERTDADAWLVDFKDGKIVSINGNEDVTYFTLKSGDGIALYVSAGQYTIAELGSKSGGSYKVKVTYTASDGGAIPDESWNIPAEKDLWLQGKSQKVETASDDIRQVFATVNFAIGEQNVVQTLTFCNQTTSLSVEKELGANDEALGKLKNYQNTDFSFNVSLRLPTDYTPLLDSENGYYYFIMNVYNVSDGSIVRREEKLRLTKGTKEENGEMIDVWNGSITLKAGQRAVIVMTVPENSQDFNYWVEEVWNKDDWNDVGWDEVNGKTNIFTELWIGQSGIAKAGKRAEAKVTNWYDEPPGYLAITERRGDPGDTFLYLITDENGNKLIVSVPGGGETIVECPWGKYTIEEITDWAWRYEDGVCEQSTDTPKGKKATVTVTGKNNTPENAVHAYYTNERNDKVWLGGESSENNHFDGPAASDKEQENNSVEQEYALLNVNDDEKKKLLKPRL